MTRHIENFTLYILALDNEVEIFFKKSDLKNIKIISLSNIEIEYPELIPAKNSRTKIEYYFTLSPVLALYLLESELEIDFITTLDADIYFFSSPHSIFDKFESYSILITKHDFTDNLIEMEKFGKYNVSFQSFRNNAEGLKCLNTWKNQCVEWCFDKYENDKFADQKYLDTWIHEYQNVLEISGFGAGIAPWNVNKYFVSKKNNHVYCDENILIFYHFHGLRFISQKIIKHSLDEYRVKPNKNIKNLIYKKYILELSELNRKNQSNDSKTLRMNSASIRGIIRILMNGHTFYHFKNDLFNIHLLPSKRIIKSIFLPLFRTKRLIGAK